MFDLATIAAVAEHETAPSTVMDDRKAALERMRRGIEATDHQLLSLIARRARQVRAVWAWKRHLGMPLYDAVREEELIRRWMERAGAMGLEPEAIELLARELLSVTAPVSRAADLPSRPPTRRGDAVEATESTPLSALPAPD